MHWVNKIKNHIKKRHPVISFSNKKPDALIVLGGDGTILLVRFVEVEPDYFFKSLKDKFSVR